MDDNSVLKIHSAVIVFLVREPNVRKKLMLAQLKDVPVEDLNEFISMLPELEEIFKGIAIDKELAPA